VVVQIAVAHVDRDAELRREHFRIDRVVRNIDRRRLLVLVFDLGLGQCRSAIETPVHRLEAAHDVAVRVDLRERADHVRFVLEIHRAIRIFPIAEHTEPLEVRALQIDLLRRVFAALRAERRRIDLLPDLADILLDRDLDRKSVAVPARHIR